MLDEIGGWDAGYRHYVEDIDLCYRAMRAGWERWYVPPATVTHAYAAVIDKTFLSRHTLWHLRGMARFARKHPGGAPRPAPLISRREAGRRLRADAANRSHSRACESVRGRSCRSTAA